MEPLLRKFLQDLQSAMTNSVLYQSFISQYQSLDALEDLLRFQHVYSVSAFDAFMHGIILEGMLESFRGSRPRTDSFHNFKLDTKLVLDVTSLSLPGEVLFRNEVIRQHSVLSFQKAENVAKGLSLVWNESYKWAKIANHLGRTEQDVKATLDAIVNRRNQIVHEADFDQVNYLKRPISKPDAEVSTRFIWKLGCAIFDQINNPLSNPSILALIHQSL